MKMFNLPRDLTEEVLCRIPLTSLRRVRSTCKKWNTFFKDPSFAKKYLVAQAKVVVMMMEFKVYLMSVNFHNNVESSCIKREGKLISLDNEVDISQVFHCEGLLLCITKDYPRLVVWNPFSGQTRLIKPTHNFHGSDLYRYALGYDKGSKSYKILRFVMRPFTVEFKIYDFNSDSWSVLDVTPDWNLHYHDSGVSLKENTYWFVKKNRSEAGQHIDNSFLICFDFTSERFGPRLPLPFQCYPRDIVCLSSVREEQLVVLFQWWDTLMMEIWITAKIEPNAVSWNSKFFLGVNMKPLIYFDYHFSNRTARFFIDEENKVAVVFDKVKGGLMKPTRNVAYIVGVDGSSKEVDLGESAHKDCFPLVCSYVPSLVQLS